MDILNAGILNLAEQRLAWLDQRQQVLAQNVANADTPNYTPADIPDFATTLRNASMVAAGTMTQTAVGHMAGTVAASFEATARPGSPTQQRTRAPDGNGVALDDELTKVADVQNMQSLTSGLYTKYMGLFRLALGRGS
jgi:flagellar basal-body rod protein FlgB